MARASTKTLIPLDRVAFYLGINPLSFNSVNLQSNYIPPSGCDAVWYQYEHQDFGRFSRESLAVILHEAEEKAQQYLGYPPLPRWIKEEEVRITQPFRPEWFNYGNMNARGAALSVNTRYGYVIEAGIVDKSVIEAGASVVYSDEDGDGYDELATVTVSTTVTDIEEIRVFFPNTNGADIWELRPVDVSIDATTSTATITFKKYLAVLPELWEAVAAPDNPSALLVDGDDNTNFLQTVDVYRVYSDASQQAVLHFEPSACSGAVGEGNTQTAVLYVRDSKHGVVTFYPATYADGVWTATTSSCYGAPQKMFVWYKAGIKNVDSDYPNIRMKPELEKLIVYYALTLADKTICGCSNVENLYLYQSEDLAKMESSSTGNSVSYQNTPEILNCPLGTSRAAVNLWRYIKAHKI